MSKEWKKSMKMISQQIENINTETEAAVYPHAKE